MSKRKIPLTRKLTIGPLDEPSYQGHLRWAKKVGLSPKQLATRLYYDGITYNSILARERQAAEEKEKNVAQPEITEEPKAE